MEVIRSYYNGDDDLIRLDTITLQHNTNFKNIVTYSDITNVSYKRNLKTKVIHINSGTPASRVVAKIEVIGDFDTLDSGYTFAKWTRGDGTEFIMDMTDLPVITETV